jgi:hypothetical protein
MKLRTSGRWQRVGWQGMQLSTCCRTTGRGVTEPACNGVAWSPLEAVHVVPAPGWHTSGLALVWPMPQVENAYSVGFVMWAIGGCWAGVRLHGSQGHWLSQAQPVPDCYVLACIWLGACLLVELDGQLSLIRYQSTYVLWHK